MLSFVFRGTPAARNPLSHPNRPAVVSFCAITFFSWLLSSGAAQTLDQQHDPEYLGDLGPQGPERNALVYGYGSTNLGSPIRVGDIGTWTFSYHVGALGIDDGGRIWLLTNIVSDWYLQTDEPTAPNYVSASTTGNARLRLRTDRRHAGPRPYWGGIEITVLDGSLAPGDVVTVTIGDRTGGSIGAHAPAIAPSSVAELRFAVDPLNSNSPVRVAKSPLAPINPGPAVRLEAVWPSEVAAGSKTWLIVRAKDQGGNAARDYRGTVEFEIDAEIIGLPAQYRFTAEDKGVRRFELAHTAVSGTYKLRVFDTEDSALGDFSNLQTVTPAESLRLFCGDLHGQHNRGSATAEQYALFARDFAGAEFMSWAVNDFHLTEANWQNINRVSAKLNEPGRFVVFPGYEWSATTSRGGDHNVIFKAEGMPLLRSGYVEHDLRGYDPATDRYTVAALLDSLDPDETIVMPHIGGRRADLSAFDPDFMYFIEVYSSHGQFEWFLNEAVERGLSAGFVASSDDAFGKLGDSPPGASGLFAVHGGITCTYADDLDRDSLWEAFKKKRVYGTTGERMQLRFRAGNHWMGEEIEGDGAIVFSVETSGTAPIEMVELFRNLDRVHLVDGAAAYRGNRLKILWRGASSKERARQSLWAGSIALSEGEFISATPYRIDQPNERITFAGKRRVEFDTVTSGDADGVIVDVSTRAMRGTLRIDALLRSRNQFGSVGDGEQTIELEFPIAEIPGDGYRRQLDGLERAIEITPMGEQYPDKIAFDWTEPETPAGTSAYWLRVTQIDGAIAWSSPIFVKR